MFSSITALFVNATSRLRREETGATAVEYGLIVGLIAIVIIAGVGLLGQNLLGLFNGIAGQLP